MALPQRLDANFKGASSMTGMLSEEHQQWLEARGLDLEVVTRYGLYTDRQSPGGRDLVIPYRRNGEVINPSTADRRSASARTRARRARFGTRIACETRRWRTSR